MAEVQPVPGAPTYKDRSTGLILFGILQVLLGLGAAGVALLLTIQVAFLPAMNAEMSWQSMAPALGVYAFIAVVLIWLTSTGGIWVLS